MERGLADGRSGFIASPERPGLAKQLNNKAADEDVFIRDARRNLRAITQTLDRFFFLPSHLFPVFEGRLATPGILPEHLNRGHITRFLSLRPPIPIDRRKQISCQG